MLAYSPIVNFYIHGQENSEGYTFEQIIGESDGFWEYNHDYFDWMFPTNQLSSRTGKIILNDADLDEFDKEMKAYDNMLVAFQRFLRFLGLVQRKSIVHLGSPKYMWQYPNRNFFKVGRCLESLRIIGCPLAASAFMEFLKEEMVKRPFVITDKTFSYWTHAASAASDYAEI